MADCCIWYGGLVYLEGSEAEVLVFTGLFVQEGTLSANWLGACLVRKGTHPLCFASGRLIIPFHRVFCLENGNIWSVIVRLASGLSYLKFALGGWACIPLCVSMYVFGVQRSIYKKEEKDTPCR